MSKPSDTSPEAARVLREVFGRLSPERKWLLLGQAYRDGRLLHAAGVRHRQPDATEGDIREAWLKTQFRLDLPSPRGAGNGRGGMENLESLRAVTAVFTKLGIAYALGGSMASSLHGVLRNTVNADLCCEPFPGREETFAQQFNEDYYLSVAAIRDAVQRRSSFNVINTATGFKVDVFIRSEDPFERAALQRRVAHQFPDAPEPVFVQSPEDVILFKCRWYRLAEEALDQQWRDILGILQTRGGDLDAAYLDRWAEHLGVTDLVARARAESEPE